MCLTVNGSLFPLGKYTEPCASAYLSEPTPRHACYAVRQGMGEVGATYVAAALVPAAIISVLFFFDHNVSAQMAQLEEFNLNKPPAYHYDLALLAFMVRHDSSVPVVRLVRFLWCVSIAAR